MPISLPPVSRRRFIKGALAAAGAVALSPGLSWADAAAPPDLTHLALLSDIHLEARHDLMAHNINMWAQFRQASDEILALQQRPGAVLINGDCAFNAGKPEDYKTVVEALKPMRDAALPIHLGLGNHDSRENLLAALGGDENLADVTDRRVLKLHLPLVDFYVLDSLKLTLTVPGTLGAVQLAWLKKNLDAAPDRAAIVMLHHQPDSRPPEKVSGLTDTADFLAVVEPRKQVKAVLFGHTHAWNHYEREGLHFVNLPTTAYVFDATQPAGWVDAHFRAGSMTLQLHAITPNHPSDKQTLDLKWR